MDLYKRVDIPRRHKLIKQTDRISLWGSCFSEELAHTLEERLYTIHKSPYGIMYNPLSMAEGLRRIIDNHAPEEGETFHYNGLWHSSMHHSFYSHADRKETVQQMRQSYDHYRRYLGDIRLFVFTFGTAYIYEEEEPSGAYKVVNNCHKRPTRDFRRRRLTPDEIITVWRPLIRRLLTLNSSSEVLMTVSPIPHYRDGAHANRLSKATLLLAIDQLTEVSDRILYYPSYEIMMDELRDYRFYEEDMAHPSPLAVRYIMDRFTATYLDPSDDRQIRQRWDKIRKQLGHRPLTTDRQQLLNHYTRIMNELSDLMNAISHPVLDKVHDTLAHTISELTTT